MTTSSRQDECIALGRELHPGKTLEVRTAEGTQPTRTATGAYEEAGFYAELFVPGYRTVGSTPRDASVGNLDEVPLERVFGKNETAALDALKTRLASAVAQRRAQT